MKTHPCPELDYLPPGDPDIARTRGLAIGTFEAVRDYYLLTTPPPGQPRLIGADASHAWLTVYCPVFGWVGFDPTNNLIPSTKHILLAWGRDFDDVSPIKGVLLGGGRHSLSVAVDVVSLDEPEVHQGGRS